MSSIQIGFCIVTHGLDAGSRVCIIVWIGEWRVTMWCCSVLCSRCYQRLPGEERSRSGPDLQRSRCPRVSWFGVGGVVVDQILLSAWLFVTFLACLTTPHHTAPTGVLENYHASAFFQFLQNPQVRSGIDRTWIETICPLHNSQHDLHRLCIATGEHCAGILHQGTQMFQIPGHQVGEGHPRESLC